MLSEIEVEGSGSIIGAHSLDSIEMVLEMK